MHVDPVRNTQACASDLYPNVLDAAAHQMRVDDVHGRVFDWVEGTLAEGARGCTILCSKSPATKSAEATAVH